MEILKIEKVDLDYLSMRGKTSALANVSLSVDEGEFVAIVGPSGCGKTSILSMVAGLIPPSSGRIDIGGKHVTAPSGEVGYMLQRDQLFEWRTVQKNVMLGLEIQNKLTQENSAYASALIDKYGLGEWRNKLPKELSGGMRQRAALIRTLAFRPKIMLLDEPFSALDFQTRLSVCDDVYNIIKSENKTALLVTHDISEALSLADRIVVLSTRPATIKNIYTVDIDRPTPLKRREDPRFAVWFDKIWKEVSI